MRVGDERKEDSRKGNGHSPEQIVRKLRQAEAKLAADNPVFEDARNLSISKSTFHRWRNRYGGMRVDRASSSRGQAGYVVPYA